MEDSKDITHGLREEGNQPVLLWAKAVARAPGTLFVFFLLVWVSLAYLGLVQINLDRSGLDGRNAYAVDGHTSTNRLDSLILARNDIRMPNITEPSLESEEEVFQLLYDAGSGNVFDPDILAAIHEFELSVRSYPGFALSHCHRCPTEAALKAELPGCELATTSNPVCRPPTSLVNHFYPSSVNISGNVTLVPDGLGTVQANVTAVLEELRDPWNLNESNPNNILQLIGKGFSQTGRSQYLQSKLSLGLPLIGRKNVADNLKQQKRDLESFMHQMLDDKLGDVSVKGVDVVVGGTSPVYSWYSNIIIQRDTQLVLAAVGFVFVVLLIRTRSVFVSVCALGGVILSFPVGYCFVWYIANQRYFDPINIFLLYAILGVGADDIFLFWGAWTQSKSHPFVSPQGLGSRLSYVFRKAGTATAVTSLTTAGALLANLSSDFVPVQVFGLLGGVAVLLNWVYAMTWFPCVLMLKDLYIDPTWAAMITKCCQRAKDTSPKVSNGIELVVTPSSAPSAALSEASNDEDRPVTVDAQSPDKGSTGFLQRYLVPFLITYRWPLLVATLGFTIASVPFAAQLTTATEVPEEFQGDHPIKTISDWSRNAFESVLLDRYHRVALVWGLKPFPNLDGFTKYDFGLEKCSYGPCGRPIYDSSFDLSSTAAQQYMLDSCNDLLQISKAEPLGEAVADCFIKDFKSWLEDNNQSFPVEGGAAALKGNYTAFFAETQNRIKYLAERRVGLDDSGNLRWVSSSVYTTYLIDDFPTRDILAPFTREMQTLEGTLNAAAPAGLQRVFFTSPSALFTLAEQSHRFAENAVRGLMVSIALVFFVLSVTILNWISTLICMFYVLSTLSILCAVLVWLGWLISPVESTILMLAVGFSVDYTVHFAIHYTHSRMRTRELKAISTVTEIGGSVVSGAITTLGSACLLLLAEIAYFYRFGAGLLVVIGVSIFYSIFSFVPFVYMFGPQGAQGDVKQWFSCCRSQRPNSSKTLTKQSSGASISLAKVNSKLSSSNIVQI